MPSNDTIKRERVALNLQREEFLSGPLITAQKSMIRLPIAAASPDVVLSSVVVLFETSSCFCRKLFGLFNFCSF